MDIHNDKTLYKLLIGVGVVFGSFIFFIVNANVGLKAGLFSIWLMFSVSLFVVYVAKTVTNPPLNHKSKNSTIQFFSYFVDIELYKTRIFLLLIILIVLSTGVWKILDKHINTTPIESVPVSQIPMYTGNK